MSDNKKYYYLKLKDGFFNEDAAVVLESMENGYIYSNIRFKLYLKSLKYDGKLMMTDRIPYDANNLESLAKVIRCDIDHLRIAIKIFKELDIIEILSNGEMYMLDIQNYIGHSSTEADRKRKYRLNIDKKLGQIEDKSPDKNPPELELEKELEKELELEKTNKKFIKPSIDEIQSYLIEKNLTSINAERFWNYYESKGWMIGKSPMKNWYAAVATWEKNNKKWDTCNIPPQPTDDQILDKLWALGIKDKELLNRGLNAARKYNTLRDIDDNIGKIRNEIGEI